MKFIFEIKLEINHNEIDCFNFIKAAALQNDENEELVHGLCAFLMGICLVFNDDCSNVYSKVGMFRLPIKNVSIEIVDLNDFFFFFHSYRKIYIS